MVRRSLNRWLLAACFTAFTAGLWPGAAAAQNPGVRVDRGDRVEMFGPGCPFDRTARIAARNAANADGSAAGFAVDVTFDGSFLVQGAGQTGSCTFQVRLGLTQGGSPNAFVVLDSATAFLRTRNPSSSGGVAVAGQFRLGPSRSDRDFQPLDTGGSRNSNLLSVQADFNPFMLTDQVIGSVLIEASVDLVTNSLANPQAAVVLDGLTFLGTITPTQPGILN